MSLSSLDEGRPINLSSVEGIITRRLIARFANKAAMLEVSNLLTA